jgi:hypothetical protein
MPKTSKIPVFFEVLTPENLRKVVKNGCQSFSAVYDMRQGMTTFLTTFGASRATQLRDDLA